MSALLLLFLTSLFIRESHAQDWSDRARRFTGESDLVKEQAVRELKEDPELENTLRKELQNFQSPKNSKMHLALDVISTLKLTSLLPDLIQLTEKDESGYGYHAINSLVTSQNRAEIIRLYVSRLDHPTTSSAAKMALLDSLGRLQVTLKEDQLIKLLKHEHFEVRSAALYYIRHFVLKIGNLDFLPLVQELLYPQIPFQLKLQALYFLTELPPKQKRSIQPFLKKCEADSHPDVKELCLKLQRPFS